MNKIAIVTGGTRGIGLAIVKRLLDDDFTVCVLGTRPSNEYPEFSKLSQHANIFYYQGDLSKEKTRKDFVDLVYKKYGYVDLLVNNAGIAPKERVDLLDMKEKSFDDLIRINVKGSLFLSQDVAKRMIDQPIKDGLRGTIINISSVSSTVTSINRGEYCISKAAISMMTKLFADRLGDEKICVYEIQPGIIQTDMTKGVESKYDQVFHEKKILINRWGLPEDVADAVSLLAEKRLKYTTGEVLHVDGGLTIQRL